jgi:zinc transporter ZupT
MSYTIYIIPFLAVILGYVITLVAVPKQQNTIKLLLSFSGAFLLSLTLAHLLPNLYRDGVEVSSDGHVHDSSGAYIMAGIVLQMLLEYFSKGAEHGHVHGHDKFKKIPYLLFFSLCIHAFLEGMPISQNNGLAYGIAIHHFPIAIILTTFFINGQLSKSIIFVFLLVFALATPLGTYLSLNLHFLAPYQKQISGLVVGILFHISSTIIFESNENHSFNIRKLIAILLGIVLALFV